MTAIILNWVWERRKPIGVGLLVVFAVAAIAGGWVLWRLELARHQITAGELDLAEQRIARLRSDVAAFEESIEACKESQDSLNGFLDSLNTRNETLQTALDAQKGEASELRHKLDQVEADFTARLAATESCPDRATEMDHAIKELFDGLPTQ